MGASVGFVQWRRHPQTVAGLVLQSAGLQWRRSLWERVLWSGLAMTEYGLRFGAPRGLTERYLRLATDQNPDLKPHLAWLKAEVRRGDPTSIAAAARSLTGFDVRACACEVDVPTTVVITKNDCLIRARRQRELADVIPGAEVVELDAAHNGWMVKPEEVADALSSAVGSVAERIGGPCEGAEPVVAVSP